jgi:hypothetical protein
MDAAGAVLECVQIDNSAAALVAEVGKAGPGAPVAVEATYGWYWAVEVLRGAGFEVHLAHPKGNASMHNRRVKTDARHATELARLLRMGDLAESWIAPPVVRWRRELVRHRHKLVRTRASLKASVHAGPRQLRGDRALRVTPPPCSTPPNNRPHHPRKRWNNNPLTLLTGPAPSGMPLECRDGHCFLIVNLWPSWGLTPRVGCLCSVVGHGVGTGGRGLPDPG